MRGLESVAAEITAAGLLFRGAFHPEPADEVPPLANGAAVGTLVLVGNAGPALWRRLCEEPAGGSDPLDHFTRRFLTAAADRAGAAVWFPFEGPPYLPFQRWAKRAEPVHASPLGILIHPDYGLWHAYRGALGFADRLPLEARIERESPCDRCEARPCLVPDDPFVGRQRCPIGVAWAYDPAQLAFHQAAWERQRDLAARQAPRG